MLTWEKEKTISQPKQMPRGMGRRISSHGGAVVPAFTAMNECGQRKERERHSHRGIKEGERERERERESNLNIAERLFCSPVGKLSRV